MSDNCENIHQKFQKANFTYLKVRFFSINSPEHKHVQVIQVKPTNIHTGEAGN